MKHLLYGTKYAALLTVMAGMVCAQSQDPLVRGKQIFDEAIQALGGEKFLTVQNRVETGRAYSFSYNGLNGASPAVFYARYVDIDPAKTGEVLAVQEHQGLGKEEDFYRIYREEGAWEVTYRGPAKMEKEQIERYRDSALHNLFYIMRVRRNEPEMLFEFQGTDVIDNTPVNVVNIIDRENRVVTAYFHPTTKLPVRQDWVWRDPETRERNEEVTRFSRYRDAGGILWPYQVHRERNGLKIYEMFAETVQVNQELNPQRFDIPTESSRPFVRKR